MTKRFSIGLAILLIFGLITGLILGGCGGKTTTTSTSSTPEVITLKFSCPFNEAEPTGAYAIHFMDLVEQNSNGRVHFERYFNEALAKHTEHIQLVGSGSVNLVMVVVTYVGQELMLNQLFDFPFFSSNAQAVASANKAFFEIPETKAVLEKEQQRLNIKILYWNTAGGNDLLCRDAVTSLADMDGKKVNMWAPGDIKIWGEFGMDAVPIYIADMYESLSRGVVDSLFFPATGSLALKLFEQAKSNLILGMGDATAPIIFNLDKFESLPSDIQDIIMAASLETSQWSVGYTEQALQMAYQVFKDSGMYVEPAPRDEQVQLFEALMKYTTEEQWVSDCNKAGVGEDAQVLLKYWRDMAWGR